MIAPTNVSGRLRSRPIIAAAYALTISNVSTVWLSVEQRSGEDPGQRGERATDGPCEHRRTVGRAPWSAGERPIVDRGAHGDAGPRPVQQEAQADRDRHGEQQPDPFVPRDVRRRTH